MLHNFNIFKKFVYFPASLEVRLVTTLDPPPSEQLSLERLREGIFRSTRSAAEFTGPASFRGHPRRLILAVNPVCLVEVPVSAKYTPIGCFWFLALVPQASKKPLGQKNTSGCL